MWIVGFVVFVIGIILTIIAPINKKKNSRCSSQTQGILKESFERDNSSGSAGHTYIYSYAVNGVAYETKSTILSKQVNEVGDPCTIWYNPNKPEEAQPFHYESVKIYNILLAIGIVMIPLGLFLILFGAAQ